MSVEKRNIITESRLDDEQTDTLFELYCNCRFQEIISISLIQNSVYTERIILYFLLFSVTASLLTGGISFLNLANLKPIWVIISVLSTVASIYSLNAQPVEKKFHNNATASAFNALALKCKGFIQFESHLDNDSQSIRQKMSNLHKEYRDLAEKLSMEHRKYGFNNQTRLTEKLFKVLEQEKAIEEVRK